MDTKVTSRPPAAIERIQEAINTHDLETLAACFDADYYSEFPIHPDRAFRGQKQMRRNWTQIFATVPDLAATLVRCASDGDTIWAEWEWRGTGRDGAAWIQRGVTIHGTRDGRTEWVRLYMEPVQEGGAGTDAAVRQSLTGRETI